MVISICSRKGGSGKSLLARSVAVAALMDRRRAVILDCDIQASCVKWAKRRAAAGTPAVVAAVDDPDIAADQAHRELRRWRDDNAIPDSGDVIVVDSPPHADGLIRLIMEWSDLVLIPVRPYPDDLESVGATVQLVRELDAPVATGLVLNACPTTAKAVSMARAALATFGLPICPTAIADRVAHPYAIAGGLVAAEYEPTGKAAIEMAAVWAWAKTLLVPANQVIRVSGHPKTLGR